MLIHLVDDEAILLKTLSHLLTYMGHQVKTFHHGEDYMQYLSHVDYTDPNVFITDIQLGMGMDGFELIDRVRCSGMLMPMVVMSASHDLYRREKNVDAMLTKPFGFSELQGILSLFQQTEMSFKNKGLTRSHIKYQQDCIDTV